VEGKEVGCRGRKGRVEGKGGPHGGKDGPGGGKEGRVQRKKGRVEGKGRPQEGRKGQVEERNEVWPDKILTLPQTCPVPEPFSSIGRMCLSSNLLQ
jgi:hypothetical protein